MQEQGNSGISMSKNEHKHEYDIVIAGGGATGCAAALCLAQNPQLKIAVVEETVSELNTDSTLIQQASFDARVIALAAQSYQQLSQFGVEMSQVQACAIGKIHVSDRGHLGQSTITPPSAAAALGYVVALAELGQQMLKQISHSSNIDYFSPATINALKIQEDKVEVQVDQRNIDAKLLVIAEGARSNTRKMANITAHAQQYDQVAVISNVYSQLPHNNIAYERFTEHGPLALLPMHNPNGRQLSLVWTVDAGEADDLLNVSEPDFLYRLQQAFGDRLGRFEARSTPYAYPLSLVTANNFIAHRTVCIGNAAQSLHPIAGQGFNLGVRDINHLAKVIEGQDPGAFSILNAYKRLRSEDKQGVITATDGLVRMFSNQHVPLVVSRNLGLLALNHSSFAKEKFTRLAMGQR